DSASAIDQTRTSMLKPQHIVGTDHAQGSKPVIVMRVPAERAQELATAMAASAKRASATVQRNLATVDGTLKDLNEAISKATQHPRAQAATVIQEASEVRRYVANLPDAKRWDFVAEAI